MNQQAMMRKLMKMKQEMEDTQKEINETEFEVSSGGIVTVTALGTKEIIKVEISEDFEAESKEEAIEYAEEVFSMTDFGVLWDIDGEVYSIEDENGEVEYEL